MAYSLGPTSTMHINRFYDESSSEAKAQQAMPTRLMHDPDLSWQDIALCAAYGATLRFVLSRDHHTTVVPVTREQLRQRLHKDARYLIMSMISQMRTGPIWHAFQPAQKLAYASLDSMLASNDNTLDLLAIAREQDAGESSTTAWILRYGVRGMGATGSTSVSASATRASGGRSPCEGEDGYVRGSGAAAADEMEEVDSLRMHVHAALGVPHNQDPDEEDDEEDEEPSRTGMTMKMRRASSGGSRKSQRQRRAEQPDTGFDHMHTLDRQSIYARAHRSPQSHPLDPELNPIVESQHPVTVA